MKKIFSCTVRDAWSRFISDVSIYEDGTVSYVRYKTPQSIYEIDKSKKPKKKHLKEDMMKEIKNILKDDSLYDIGEIEFPLVMDGFHYDINFSNNDKEVEYHAHNLYNCRGKKRFPNANKLINVLDEIQDLLAIYGINKKYFEGF